MASLPLATTTETSVKAYMKRPSAVLVLHGPAGVGKTILAEKLIANILNIVHEKLITYPYLIRLEPDEKGSITIDNVRSVQSALIRSVPGSNPVRRAVLVSQAEKLTLEAQNALLKALEEPPSDTVFIMTVDNLQHLLSTVVSRSQPLAVLPISEEVARNHFGDNAQVTKAYYMSGGRANLLLALLNDSEHPLLESIKQAKEVLQQSSYERLLLVNALSKDKLATSQLLEALLLLARISLASSVKGDNTVQAKRWHDIIKQVSAASSSLQKNASPKMVLTDLFLHL